MTHEEVGDDALLELGRLAWAAIILEDLVRAMVWLVLPVDVVDTAPIGSRVNDALIELRKRPNTAQIAELMAWLGQATAALEERNSVLHGVPVFFVPMSRATEELGTSGQHLHHFPRKANAPQRQIAATVAGLSPIRRRLEAPARTWRDIYLAVSEV